jgi:hypothetical protein
LQERICRDGHPGDQWFVLTNRETAGFSLFKRIFAGQISTLLFQKLGRNIHIAAVSQERDTAYRDQQCQLFLSKFEFAFNSLYNQQPQQKDITMNRFELAQLLSQASALLTQSKENTSIHEHEAVYNALVEARDKPALLQFISGPNTPHAIIEAVAALHPKNDLNDDAKVLIAGRLDIEAERLRKTSTLDDVIGKSAPVEDSKATPAPNNPMIKTIDAVIDYICNGAEASATDLRNGLEIVKGFLMSHSAVLSASAAPQETENTKVGIETSDLFTRLAIAVRDPAHFNEEEKTKMIDDLRVADQHLGQTKRDCELKDYLDDAFQGLASIMQGGMHHIDKLLTQMNQLRRDFDMGKFQTQDDSHPGFGTWKMPLPNGVKLEDFTGLVMLHYAGPRHEQIAKYAEKALKILMPRATITVIPYSINSASDGTVNTVFKNLAWRDSPTSIHFVMAYASSTGSDVLTSDDRVGKTVFEALAGAGCRVGSILSGEAVHVDLVRVKVQQLLNMSPYQFNGMRRSRYLSDAFSKLGKTSFGAPQMPPIGGMSGVADPGLTDFQRHSLNEQPFPGADLPFRGGIGNTRGWNNGWPSVSSPFTYGLGNQPLGRPMFGSQPNPEFDRLAKSYGPGGFQQGDANDSAPTAEQYDGVIMLHIPDAAVDYEVECRQSMFTEAYPNAKFYLVRYPEYGNQPAELTVAQAIQNATVQYGTLKIFHFILVMNNSPVGYGENVERIVASHLGKSVKFKVDHLQNVNTLRIYTGSQVYEYASANALAKGANRG